MQWLEFQILPIAVERLYEGDLMFDDGWYVSLPNPITATRVGISCGEFYLTQLNYFSNWDSNKYLTSLLYLVAQLWKNDRI